MVLPIKGFSRQLAPGRSISKAQARRECRRHPPAVCSNLVSFPKYGACAQSLGGLGVGGRAGLLLQGGGPRGEPAGEAEIIPAAAL